MTRTVVSFGPLGNATVLKLERAPGAGGGALDGKRIKIGPLVGADAMTRGRELMRLLSRHVPVKEAIRAALQATSDNPPQALYFHVEASSADELPWELLHAGPGVGFCALDSRWPVGRIAASRRDVSPRAFMGSLKTVAVLSAAGQSGLSQLNSLIGALRSPEGVQLGARLHVISGEQAVLDRAAAAGADVTVEELANNPADAANQIAAARPSVVHILCHGGMAAGVRTLALATAADYAGQEETGLVRLKVADLVAALAKCNPWLLVLAACETAESGDGTALAHELANSGIPAVIGMRRLVDVGDTDQFCAALYPEMMRTVAKTLDPAVPDLIRELDWAGTLTGPRQSVSGPDPVEVDTWSDPVLYVQGDTLQIYRQSGAAPLSLPDFAGLQAQLDKWVTFRSTLDVDTAPPDAISETDARIAALQQQLAAARA
jgi:hypothetical protein